ncbi:MAG: PRC-barrel domain-containing protein [Verrucomicrobiota bacterium]
MKVNKKLNLTTWSAVAAMTFYVAATTAFADDSDTNSLSATSSQRELSNPELVNKITGREVRNNDNQRLGKVEDLVVDLESGRILYTVVSVGGFLGIGDRQIAVPPSAVTEKGKQLRLDADKDKLMDAPQFSQNEDVKTQLTPQFVSRVNEYFGQSSSWFQNAEGKMAEKFGNVHKASDLIGMDVHNVANRTIGEVNNIVVDLPSSRVVYVVLEPDSSLNLKDNLYALPPNALTLSSDGKSLNTGIDENKLASAPHFNKDNWPNLSDQSLAGKIYQFYGKQPYFENGSLQPTSNRTNALERIYHEPDQSK